jgi:crotonobetainyl-CoA:carnitine CoA-transferase CaiB-like acyl-CoA transferase
MPRIIDLTRMLAGPFGTMILGDLGFDIIKIEERKSGDYTRRTPPYRNGMSAYFFAGNRNKKSIILDMKNPAGREVVLDLVKSADGVVENFRPGVMDHLNLGYETLSAVNPRIILVSINGFGSTGPLKDKTSFDLVAQAMAGTMSLSATDDGEPLKPAIPMGDVGGGIYAAIGLLNAMRERRTTGRGKHLEVSLLDSMVAQSAHVGEQFLLGSPKGEQPYRYVPNGVFPTADGHIVIAAYTDDTWTALCKTLAWDDYLANRTLGAMEGRTAAGVDIKARLVKDLAAQGNEHWLKRFEQGGVPAAAVAGMPAVFANPDLAARNMLPEIPHSMTGPLQTFGNPIRRIGSPYRNDTLPPPCHGEHTEEVLRTVLGYSDEKIRNLLAAGAWGPPVAATR